jgi:hypothetical protein
MINKPLKNTDLIIAINDLKEGKLEIRNFVVLYREPESKPDEPPMGFQCWASNVEHAEEQCKNSYPDCDIVWVWEGKNGVGISSALRDYYRSGQNGWINTQTYEQYVDFDRELFSFPDKGSTSIDMKLTFNLETRDCYFTIRTANNSGEIRDWEQDHKLSWDVAIDMLRKDGVQLPIELENPSAQDVNDSTLTAEQLDEKYNQDGGGQHPIHTRLAWAQEVGAQNTLLGYWDWLKHQIEVNTAIESEEKPTLALQLVHKHEGVTS